MKVTYTYWYNKMFFTKAKFIIIIIKLKYFLELLMYFQVVHILKYKEYPYSQTI